jgi:hypothetical protein
LPGVVTRTGPFRQVLARSMHPSCLPIDQLESDCGWRFARRSGPGGQHRNKVESAAIVEHKPTGIIAEANERRSQAENRRIALHRLRISLALAHRQAAGPTPGPWWQAHIAQGKIRVANDHDNFPAILAELLDKLAGIGWQVEEAATWLGTSKSQIIRLLAQLPAALELFNSQRTKLGLRTLKP